MTENTFKYDFFISYRHGEPDTQIAQYLQRALEHYKIPKEIREKSGKQKINRVFRDNEELSASFDLAGEIREQLRSSEFLIVVCSPRTRESRWVMQEIQTFIELRGREYILPVLIEGEPADSFPDILLETEPLAADFRADSTRHILRKCRKEMLRLIAPALHCSYDELRQRHKAYQMRRLAAAASAAAAFFLVFGIYSFRQSVQIRENYEQKQINQSRYLAQESQDLLDSGDREAALLTAKAALPESEDSGDKPLVGEAQMALENALYLYYADNGNYYYPDQKLELNDSFTSVYAVDKENELLACCDRQGTTYYWDLKNDTAYNPLPLPEGMDDIEYLFLGENGTAYLADTYTIICYDYINEEIQWTWTADSGYGEACSISPDKSIIAFTMQSTVYDGESSSGPSRILTIFIDAQSGSAVSEISVQPENSQDTSSWMVNETEWKSDGSALCISVYDGTVFDDSQNALYLLEPASGSSRMLYQWTGGLCCAMMFSDQNTLIFLYDVKYSMTLNIMYDTLPYSVAELDCTSGGLNWQIENASIARDGQYIIGTFSDVDASDASVWVIADTEVLHIRDGEVLGEFPYARRVAGVNDGPRGAYHITQDGILHEAFLDSGTLLNETYGHSDLGLDDLGAAEWTDSGKLLLFPNDGEAVYVYSVVSDPEQKFIPGSENITTSIPPVVSPSGKYIAGLCRSDETDSENSEYRYFNIWDSNSGECIWSYQTSYLFEGIAGFFGDDYCYFATEKEVCLYSLKDREITGTCKNPSENSADEFCGLQAAEQSDEPCIFFQMAGGLTRLSGRTLEITAILTPEEIQELTGWEPAYDGDTIASYEYSYCTDPTGRYAAVWLNEGYGEDTSPTSAIYFYDIENKTALDVQSGLSVIADTNYPNCIFSDDGTRALVYGTDRQIHIIDLPDGTESDTVPLEGDSYRAFWLSPDNRYLFLHSRTRMLSVYDTETRTYTMNSEKISYDISDWKFSENGSELYLTTQYTMSYPICFTLRNAGEGVYEYTSIVEPFADISSKYILEMTDNGLYRFPRRSLDEMLALADEILDGRELTDLEKQRYFVED